MIMSSPFPQQSIQPDASAQSCSCGLCFAVGPYNGLDEVSISVSLLFLTYNSNPNANLHL